MTPQLVSVLLRFQVGELGSAVLPMSVKNVADYTASGIVGVAGAGISGVAGVADYTASGIVGVAGAGISGVAGVADYTASGILAGGKSVTSAGMSAVGTGISVGASDPPPPIPNPPNAPHTQQVCFLDWMQLTHWSWQAVGSVGDGVGGVVGGIRCACLY